MDKNQINTCSSGENGHEEDFEFMGDTPKEDPAIAERRRLRQNQITKKLGEYLLKGYCMLSDTCSDCDCILLRTPEKQLLCVVCNEIDVDKKKQHQNEKTPVMKKNTDTTKSSTKHKDKKQRSGDNLSDYNKLENKLKWAVDELTKSQSPNRISDMCAVIIKLTETIKILKEHELSLTQH
ncbi:unnamed protein product [Adineta steineri]|uniref:Sjoegren syndrome/scleroderma autoantigen 1 n=1 Tax=Adineta steineri TaxID=433720 RepID=A0A818J3G0_9BILA|nr:unnamed protein product [Adineta steineri]CAF3532942.1 unnamed protein product [Adineta steineri]